MSPRIIFHCGKSSEEWAPPSIDADGIGGSETAVIRIAERLARAGWRVDVFNDAGRYEGEYDEVGYWDCRRLRPDERCDVLVGWRRPDQHAMPITARTRILWLHDLHYGPQAGEHMSKWDRVLGVSQWHAQMLRRYYGADPSIGHVLNGIDPERWHPAPDKTPWSCVYASSPDRGLGMLLGMWPKLLEDEPAATLDIAYGWQGIDGRIAQGDQAAEAFKADIQRQIEALPSVRWHGRLGQNALAGLFSKAWLLPYPTNFLETNCITVVQAMASGVVPVCPGVGALTETVGKGGVIVPGWPDSRVWRDSFIRVISGLFVSPTARLPKQEMGISRAKELSWDAAYVTWEHEIAVLLGERQTLESAA